MDSLKRRHCKEKDGGGSPGGVRGGRGGVRGGGRFGCSNFLLLFGGGPPLYPVGFEPGALQMIVGHGGGGCGHLGGNFLMWWSSSYSARGD